MPLNATELCTLNGLKWSILCYVSVTTVKKGMGVDREESMRAGNSEGGKPSTEEKVTAYTCQSHSTTLKAR